MNIQAIHDLVFSELKVISDKGYIHKKRNDDFRNTQAIAIFSMIAKNNGHDSVAIAYVIRKDFSSVNKYIRDFKTMALENDFISENIIEHYKRINELVKRKS